MVPTQETAGIYAFPKGGRAGVAMQKAEDHMTAIGAEGLALGTAWYHEAAVVEAKRGLEPRELPWWAEAEHESRAKNIVRSIY